MKNKKYIILIIAIVAVICLTIVIIKMNNRSVIYNTSDSNSVDVSIRSTNENPLKEGDVEVKDIQVHSKNGQLEIVSTLKNNSDHDINGFFIMISLYDTNGKDITTFASNESKTIPAKGTYELKNYAEEPKGVTIGGAKIVSLEIN